MNREGEKREKEGGKRENKWVWGSLSLWWIDRETRGSQKEKCKNRIAPPPWHLSSLPIYPITSLLALSFPPPALPSPMTFPALPSSPPGAVVLRWFLKIKAILPSSVSIHSCAYTYTHKRKTKTSLSHWVSSSSHHSGKGFKTFYWSQMTHLYNKLWLVIITYLHTGIAYKALCPLNISCLALLCIHAVTKIHIQTSGLWGTLMEAVQSTTYCPVCLKCSTSQTALRPQMWEWKQSSATLPTFSPSLTSILVLSSPISITFSLINHPPNPPSLHSSSSLQRGKTNSCQGQACRWIPNDFEGQRGWPTFSRGAGGWNTCARGWKQARKQHQINMVTLRPPPTHTHIERSCSLNQYCILS